jgi:hypothetical protein
VPRDREEDPGGELRATLCSGLALIVDTVSALDMFCIGHEMILDAVL